MEPLNYLRAATACMHENWLPWARRHHPLDARAGEAILREADKAPKFVIPKGGRILFDELKGLPRDFRLPYPITVIEYEANDEPGMVTEVYGEENTCLATKRIVVAREAGVSEIEVFSIIYVSDPRWGGKAHRAHSRWVLQPAGATIFRDSSAPRPERGKGAAIGDLAVSVFALGSAASADPSIGKDWAEHAYHNLIDECAAALELIEALACSNVSHEAMPVRKLNKGAARRGALPFHEYRTLVVNARSGGSGSRNGDGSHRSPREHLRRGHIRRLGDGRQLWINSTVVNAGRGGVIQKVYTVQP